MAFTTRPLLPHASTCFKHAAYANGFNLAAHELAVHEDARREFALIVHKKSEGSLLAATGTLRFLAARFLDRVQISETHSLWCLSAGDRLDLIRFFHRGSIPPTATN